jgi:RNA polymerase sigma-70 factor (ECF subfamily)
MQNRTDQELIAHSLDGDHQAYAQLVDRYKTALYRHCFAIVRSEDVAEDIAQEAFITAYYRLRLYDQRYRFSTWLFKIATNLALNWLKRASREIQVDDATLARIVSTAPLPEEQAAHSELRQLVSKLQPNYRAVISLYYWQGLSYQEVAVVLGAPIGTVKVWMRRAKQALQKELS